MQAERVRVPFADVGCVQLPDSVTDDQAVEPDQVLTRREGMVSAVDAYREFDRRAGGWTKVELEPAGV
jgi:threonine dehydrogenase-like Zn-dependent dehydrogenase